MVGYRKAGRGVARLDLTAQGEKGQSLCRAVQGRAERKKARKCDIKHDEYGHGRVGSARQGKAGQGEESM